MFNWLTVLQNTQLHLCLEHKSNKFHKIIGFEILYVWFTVGFTENVLYVSDSHFHVQMKHER